MIIIGLVMNMYLTTALQLLICLRLGQCHEISTDLMQILKNYSDKRRIPTVVRFGLSIGEGDLSSTDVHCSKYSSNLLDTLNSLKDTFQENINDSIYKGIIIHDIIKNNWKIAPDSVVFASIQPSKNITIESYLNKVNYGKPTRLLSDICLSQILTTRSCVINSECMDIITSKDNLSFGYHRTHQILFLLVLKKQKCNSWITYNLSLKTLFSRICTEILNESVTLLNAGIPNEFHDLFLEQALVCSLAGFSEFLSEEWISQIRKLSHQITSNHNQNSSKRNSSIQYETNEYSDHMASLAIAFLSRIIKISCFFNKFGNDDSNGFV